MKSALVCILYVLQYLVCAALYLSLQEPFSALAQEEHREHSADTHISIGVLESVGPRPCCELVAGALSACLL